MASTINFVLVSTFGGSFVALLGSYATEALGRAAVTAHTYKDGWESVDPKHGIAAWCISPTNGDHRHVRSIELVAVEHTAA